MPRSNAWPPRRQGSDVFHAVAPIRPHLHGTARGARPGRRGLAPCRPAGELAARPMGGPAPRGLALGAVGGIALPHAGARGLWCGGLVVAGCAAQPSHTLAAAAAMGGNIASPDGPTLASAHFSHTFTGGHSNVRRTRAERTACRGIQPGRRRTASTSGAEIRSPLGRGTTDISGRRGISAQH